MNRTPKKKPRVPETPVNLCLWIRDGAITTGNDWHHAEQYPKYPTVEVGRTDSKRRLGFLIQMTAKAPVVLFTLDRAQVKNLRNYLDRQLRRLMK